MQVYQNSRRNFLNNIAILSAGTAFKPATKYFPSIIEQEDLQKKWELFWKKSGGQKFYTFTDLQSQNNLFNTKGHLYKNGEIIYFSKENILAQPTWIYWGNSLSKPADVVITLFDNNSSLKKISRLNRFEIDALYKVSNDHCNDNLLEAHCNNVKPAGNAISLLKNKISITKNSEVQQVSYYKDRALVLHKKFINHS
jgi:hypothetical protein